MVTMEDPYYHQNNEQPPETYDWAKNKTPPPPTQHTHTTPEKLKYNKSCRNIIHITNKTLLLLYQTGIIASNQPHMNIFNENKKNTDRQTTPSNTGRVSQHKPIKR